MKSESEKSKKVRERKFPVQSLIIEVISIVLGVMLAFMANDWREDQSNKSKTETALVNLKAEIRTNIELLTSIHANNSATLNIINKSSLAENDKNTIIPGIQLQNTAWETILTTGISNNLDYETVLKISKCYSIQDVYKQTGMLLSESTMNMTAYAVVSKTEIDNRIFQKQFLPYFEIFVEVESVLLDAYQNLFDHLETS